jgi:hypothetical protein
MGMRKPFLFLAAFLLPLASAWAYIPPSSFILKSITSKHAGLKGLRVRSTVTVMDEGKPGTTRFKAVTFFNPATQTVHAYAFDDRNQKLYGVERRPEGATAADAVLFWKDERSLNIALKARGLPVRSDDELLKMKDEDERRAAEDEHLTRWNAGVVWVIGGSKSSKSGNFDDPQLWVEKDSFLPLRLIAAPQPESEIVDLHFEGQRYYHEFPYPKTILAFNKKKVPLFKDEVQDVALSIDGNEFKTPVMPGFTETGNNAPSAVRELIQKYFEVLR